MKKAAYIVHVDEVRPLGRVVEEGIVLLHEALPDGLVVDVQCHDCRFEVMCDDQLLVRKIAWFKVNVKL